MVRTNPDSVFQELDLDNAESLRRLMCALWYYLSRRVLRPYADELDALVGSERTIANSILSYIRINRQHYPLLLEGTLLFISSRTRDDKEVLRAAREFEALGFVRVLTKPQAFPEEYEAADREFRARVGVDGQGAVQPEAIAVQSLSSPTSKTNRYAFRHQEPSASKSFAASPMK
jgi:hypothetical protein